MDARKSEVASSGEIINDSQIFFEVTGPPTRGRVLGMGAGVKPRDVYGPSSSSQCSKQYQVDCLKEKEDFELHFKEVEDKKFCWENGIARKNQSIERGEALYDSKCFEKDGL